jgi:hypothetical protein
MIDLVLGNSRLASTGIRARSCCVKGGKVQVSHGYTLVREKDSENLALEFLISKLFLMVFALLSLKGFG